jgi:membrane-associated protein
MSQFQTGTPPALCSESKYSQLLNIRNGNELTLHIWGSVGVAIPHFLRDRVPIARSHFFCMHALTDFLHSILSADGIRHLIVTGGYLALFIIVFVETGLLLGFFLPGDSLLVTTGLLIATHIVNMDMLTLNLILISAAILGDATGYFIGYKAGHALYNRPNSRFFKRDHLMKTHKFYEKHGGKTIIFARFVPIVRTFAPVVAGASEMGYKKFAIFNIIGGVLWIVSTTMLGYSLGGIPNAEQYLHIIIFAVIFLSLLPPIIEWLRNRKTKPAEVSEII